MGFSRQEHWSELPCPPPGDGHNPGIEPTSLNVSCTERQVFFPISATWEAHRQLTLEQLGVRVPTLHTVENPHVTYSQLSESC